MIYLSVLKMAVTINKVLVVTHYIWRKAGFIYVSILKGGMSNVQKSRAAARYMNDSSYKKGKAVDIFMYSKTEKKEKPKQ